MAKGRHLDKVAYDGIKRMLEMGKSYSDIKNAFGYSDDTIRMVANTASFEDYKNARANRAPRTEKKSAHKEKIEQTAIYSFGSNAEEKLLEEIRDLIKEQNAMLKELIDGMISQKGGQIEDHKF